MDQPAKTTHVSMGTKKGRYYIGNDSQFIDLYCQSIFEMQYESY